MIFSETIIIQWISHTIATLDTTQEEFKMSTNTAVNSYIKHLLLFSIANTVHNVDLFH